MASPSKVIREFKRGMGRSGRLGTKKLEDKSYIDVEAREVKPKLQLTDKTMRADKRDMGASKPKGRSGRAAAIAAGAAATAAGVAALSGKDEKKQPTSPSAVGAKSKTESKKETKAAPAKTAAKKGLSDFEKKFKEMRAAGKDTFTWNGKKITTRYKEETDAQHKANVAKIRSKNETASEKVLSNAHKMKSGGMAKKR